MFSTLGVRVVKPRGFVDSYQRFGRTRCPEDGMFLRNVAVCRLHGSVFLRSVLCLFTCPTLRDNPEDRRRLFASSHTVTCTAFHSVFSSAEKFSINDTLLFRQVVS